MTFKEFYKKYINYIVIVLIGMVMIKGCQCCNKDRQMVYKSSQYEIIIDSLNNNIDSLSKEIDALKDTNVLYINEIKNLTKNNKSLNEANRYYRNTNNTLVNTNKKLTENKEL